MTISQSNAAVLRWLAFAATFLALAAAACEDRPFKQDLKLGGKNVSAATLNHGKEMYMLHCQACHGEKGDGKGIAAKGLVPPPRNFTAEQVLFKFGSVPAGELPTDDDLKRIVKNGLHGTAMLKWEVHDSRLEAILQYIKTFSPRWVDNEPGEPVAMSPDPYGAARAAEAVEAGKKLYHTKVQCNQCHPAYASREELDKISQEVAKKPYQPRPDLYFSKITDSPDFETKILPPDFTWHPLRSVHPETRRQDLYRVIAAGIGGAAMPSWKGTVTEEELWAIVYYVETLMDLAAQPAKRNALMGPLRNSN